MRLSPERIPAPDHRSVNQVIADAIARQKNERRQQIETLRTEYQSLAVVVNEIDPRYRIASFPEGDTAQLGLPDLDATVASAKELVVGLRSLIPQLNEQREAKRKAGLSPNELLQEEVANLKEELAIARARFARIEARLGLDLPDTLSSPSLRHKPSSTPPMLIATAQRGGGTVNRFFGDDPHAPPSGGGVRRAGRRDGFAT